MLIQDNVFSIATINVSLSWSFIKIFQDAKVGSISIQCNVFVLRQVFIIGKDCLPAIEKKSEQ